MIGFLLRLPIILLVCLGVASVGDPDLKKVLSTVVICVAFSLYVRTKNKEHRDKLRSKKNEI